MAVWNQSRLSDDWHKIERTTAKSGQFIGVRDQWKCTDFVLDLSREQIVLGIEHGRACATCDATHVEIEEQLRQLLEDVGKLLPLIENIFSEQSIVSLVTAVEQDGNDQADVAWAREQLKQLFDRSLRPSRQPTESSSILDFAGLIRPAKRSQGWPIDWSIESQSESCQVWSHAGPRQFQDKAVQHLFWAQQGSPERGILASSRPFIPRNRIEIFDNCFLAAEANLTREKIHRALSDNEYDLQRHRFKALQHVGADLSTIRKLAANLKRYRLNTADAMLGLGMLNDRRGNNDLLDYLDDSIKQVELESDRFTPEMERVDLEIERVGGILGWPGFVLATTALVLATLGTWWGAAGAFFDRSDFVNDRGFVALSLIVISLCPVVAAVVLFFVGLRETRRIIMRNRLSGAGIVSSTFNGLLSRALIFFCTSGIISLLSWKSLGAVGALTGKTALTVLVEWFGRW